MSPLDIALIVILVFFISTGFRYGLIITLGALIGTVVGIVVAGHYFEQGAELLASLIANHNLARVVAFVVIFILTARIVGIVFWAIDKAFKFISIIPFLKSINRLGGMILGAVEGVVVLGIALVFIDKFPFSDYIIPSIETSQIAQWLLGYGTILAPLLPEAVKLLEGHVKLPIEIPEGLKGEINSK